MGHFEAGKERGTERGREKWKEKGWENIPKINLWLYLGVETLLALAPSPL